MRTDCGGDDLIFYSKRGGENGVAKFGRSGKTAGKIEACKSGVQFFGEALVAFCIRGTLNHIMRGHGSSFISKCCSIATCRG
ncbi:hypothetical protein D3C87_1279840 [compost metagenome]